MELVDRLVLMGLVLVSWYLLYRDYLSKQALRHAVSNLVNIQEVLITKLDALGAAVHDLPYGFKQSCDKFRKELSREVLRSLTVKDGKLRKDVVEQIVKKIEEGKSENKRNNRRKDNV